MCWKDIVLRWMLSDVASVVKRKLGHEMGEDAARSQ